MKIKQWGLLGLSLIGLILSGSVVRIGYLTNLKLICWPDASTWCDCGSIGAVTPPACCIRWTCRASSGT